MISPDAVDNPPSKPTTFMTSSSAVPVLANASVDAPNTCPCGAAVHDGQLERPSLLPSDLPSPFGLGGVLICILVGVGVGVAVGTIQSSSHSPLVPVAPLAPEVPLVPVAPLEPVDPVTPVAPLDPVVPVAPEGPVVPELPVAPVEPLVPDASIR